MTTAMKAAFTLTLQDQLTSGLRRIQQQFEGLRAKGNELNLGKLERADNVLRTLAREVRNLSSDMRGIEAAADRGWAAMKRMASTNMQTLKGWGRNTFGAESRLGGAAGGIAAVAGGISLIDPVRRYAKYVDDLIHIGITKGLSGTALQGEVVHLQKRFNADALETGQSSASISEAYGGLLKRGIGMKLVDESIVAHSMAATAYQTTAEAFTGATAAMLQNFLIGPGQLPQALAALGQTTKEGMFKAADFSAYLPSVGAQFARNGMTGLGSANLAMAALQTTMRDVHEPGQAATDLVEGMRYVFSGAGARAFGMENLHKGEYSSDIKKLIGRVLGHGFTGININRLFQNAEKQGINPIFALVPKLQGMTSGLSNSERSELFTALFHNESAGMFWGALTNHNDFFSDLLTRLNNLDPGQLKRDETSAMSSPQITLNKGAEAWEQLERRVGQGFEPVVSRLVGGLESVIGGVNGLDEKLPGLGNAALGVTGSLLGLVSALGALGFVAPAIKGGAVLAGAAAGRLTPYTLPLALSGDSGPPAAKYDPITNPNLFDRNGAIGRWWDRWWDRLAPDTVLDQLKMKRYKETPLFEGGPIPDLPLKLRAPSSTGFEPPGAVDGTPGAPPPPPRQELDITIHTEPGTTATINHATDGVNLKTPNPGATTNLP